MVGLKSSENNTENVKIRMKMIKPLRLNISTWLISKSLVNVRKKVIKRNSSIWKWRQSMKERIIINNKIQKNNIISTNQMKRINQRSNKIMRKNSTKLRDQRDKITGSKCKVEYKA